LRALINNTEKIVYENSPKLRINDECIRRLQQDLLNIIVLDAHKETKGKAEPSPQEQKRPPRGKLSLF
jgi:DNA-binding protein YbaB